MSQTTCRRGQKKENHPANAGRTTGSERRETGGRAFNSRRESVAQGNVLPCLVAGPEHRGECRRDYSTTWENLWGSSPHLAGGHRCGRGSHGLFFLVAPVLLEGSSVGRAAGFGPVGRGFEPFPSSHEFPGECRADYSLENCLPRPLSPGPETPRRMPCGTTAWNARGRGFESRRALQHCGRVAQLDRARRVAKPLSPGTMM